MKTVERRKWYHELFRISIFLKGLDGLLELIGALVLIVVSSETISAIVNSLFREELLQDPGDFIANLLVNATQSLTLSTQHFIALYLFVHGIIKVGLVTALWKDKLWAFPIAGVVLFLMVLYQAFRLGYSFSWLLFFITLLDLIILVLLRSEYVRQVRLNARKKKANAA